MHTDAIWRHEDQSATRLMPFYVQYTFKVNGLLFPSVAECYFVII